MSFGTFIKEKRLEAGLSLRNFCSKAELDPSNWSKIERDRLAAPDDREKLEKIAAVLKFEKGSNDWLKLFDLVAISKQKIPDYVYSDDEVIKALPIFFRTASGSKPTEEELETIMKILKGR